MNYEEAWKELKKRVQEMDDQSWFDGVSPYSSVLEEMEIIEEQQCPVAQK